MFSHNKIKRMLCNTRLSFVQSFSINFKASRCFNFIKCDNFSVSDISGFLTSFLKEGSSIDFYMSLYKGHANIKCISCLHVSISRGKIPSLN